jgi:hypothetical protein
LSIKQIKEQKLQELKKQRMKVQMQMINEQGRKLNCLMKKLVQLS